MRRLTVVLYDIQFLVIDHVVQESAERVEWKAHNVVVVALDAAYQQRAAALHTARGAEVNGIDVYQSLFSLLGALPGQLKGGTSLTWIANPPARSMPS